MSDWWRIYITPAAIFVSVIIGGGYGTGREIVEFFSRYGTSGGLYGIALATFSFAIILGVTYEIARIHQSFDYKNFFQSIIGPFWWLFEILYLLLFLLVLGVVSSAVSNMIEEYFNIHPLVGPILMLILVTLLIIYGREAIEKILTAWSFGMYFVFFMYFYQVLGDFEWSNSIVNEENLTSTGWWQGGLLYVMYNVAIAPVLLFTARAYRKRSESFLSGFISAILVMIPALLFHLSYIVGMPEIIDQSLPNYWMMKHFTSSWLLSIFIVALIGTLVETAAGLVQGVIERIESVSKSQKQRTLTKWQRGCISTAAILLSAAFGQLGIISLIGKGYSFLAIGFGLVYLLPLFTIGIYKLFKYSKNNI